MSPGTARRKAKQQGLPICQIYERARARPPAVNPPLPLAGMKCAGCVSRVKGLLEGQPPVVGASVNLATETAMVRVRLPPAIAVTPGPAASANGRTAPATPLPGSREAQRQGGGAKGEQGDLEQGLAPPSPLEALGDSLAKVRLSPAGPPLGKNSCGWQLLAARLWMSGGEVGAVGEGL